MSQEIQETSQVKRRSATAAARELLQQRLDEVLRVLPLALEQWQQQPNAVHDLRVAIRRAATALDLFAELLPPKRARRLREQLQQLRRASDDARDCDVLLARLSSEGNGRDDRELVDQLYAHRRAAQQPLEQVAAQLQDEQCLEREAQKLLARLSHPRRGAARRKVPFVTFARQALGDQAHRFGRKAKVDVSDAKKLHRFRICTKQLRYSLDLLAGAVDPKRSKRLHKKLKRLQEMLGAVNDHAAALDLLERLSRDIAAPGESTLKPQQGLEQQALDAKRKEFDEWWTPKRRKSLRRQLRKIIGEE